MNRIGLCGYGTVGQSLLKLIKNTDNTIPSNISDKFIVSMIADRSIAKKKYDKSITVTENVMDLAKSEEIDIIVELIGGTDVAYDVVITAIKNQKHIITANKALIAEFGDEIFELAAKNNVFVGFEASVAGAIPIINTLTNNFANEQIKSIIGIINGTCNFILEQMSSSNLSFNDALQKAKQLGYAEADPSFDINGTDAAHKISILASIAYKIKSPLKNVTIEGIEKITSMDIKYSRELGYMIKHVGITNISDQGIECRTHPVLVSSNNILSNVNGVMNAVMLTGDNFGTSMLYGHGAGGDATASAVLADIAQAINIPDKLKITNNHRDSFSLNSLDIMDNDCLENPYYLRIYAEDVSGVMAEITNILAKEKISIEAVTQHEPADTDSLIPIVMITDTVNTKSIDNVIKKIEKLPHVKDDVFKIRVLKINE